MQGCVRLHCGGPGQNVNAGRQPPLHDGPGKGGQGGREGARGGTEGAEERQETLKTLWHFAGNDF